MKAHGPVNALRKRGQLLCDRLEAERMSDIRLDALDQVVARGVPHLLLEVAAETRDALSGHRKGFGLCSGVGVADT